MPNDRARATFVPNFFDEVRRRVAAGLLRGDGLFTGATLRRIGAASPLRYGGFVV